MSVFLSLLLILLKVFPYPDSGGSLTLILIFSQCSKTVPSCVKISVSSWDGGDRMTKLCQKTGKFCLKKPTQYKLKSKKTQDVL